MDTPDARRSRSGSQKCTWPTSLRSSSSSCTSTSGVTAAQQRPRPPRKWPPTVTRKSPVTRKGNEHSPNEHSPNEHSPTHADGSQCPGLTCGPLITFLQAKNAEQKFRTKRGVGERQKKAADNFGGGGKMGARVGGTMRSRACKEESLSKRGNMCTICFPGILAGTTMGMCQGCHGVGLANH